MSRASPREQRESLLRGYCSAGSVNKERPFYPPTPLFRVERSHNRVGGSLRHILGATETSEPDPNAVRPNLFLITSRARTAV